MTYQLLGIHTKDGDFSAHNGWNQQPTLRQMVTWCNWAGFNSNAAKFGAFIYAIMNEQGQVVRFYGRDRKEFAALMHTIRSFAANVALIDWTEVVS